MAMIQCEACQGDISKQAKQCPKCGHPNKKATGSPIIKTIGYLFLVIIGLSFFAGGGFKKQMDKEMASIENQVATDSVKQYDIAKAQGDQIQICVQAGFVSAAYLQAEDKTNYNLWKGIEKTDCRKAGLPQ